MYLNQWTKGYTVPSQQYLFLLHNYEYNAMNKHLNTFLGIYEK